MVAYTCDEGFELTPTAVDPQSFNITCKSDGTWESLQECIGVYNVMMNYFYDIKLDVII